MKNLTYEKNISKYYMYKYLTPNYNYPINEGGFGDIYKCNENNDIAIKLINKDEKEMGECNKRIVKYLNHPNILKIYGFDKKKYKSIYLIFMEMLNGITLKDYLIRKRGKPIDKLIIREILYQILQGLSYLHSHKITHRDIKLDNIVIINDNNDDNNNGNNDNNNNNNNNNRNNIKVKIVDFGLSHYGYPCKGTVGTSGYFAPEMLYSKNNYDSKCDIWSLGCILYYMVCGHFPFYKFHDKELYIKQLLEKKNINYNESEWKNFGSLQFLCQNMLVYDNEKRYSAKDCLKELSKIYQ